MTDSRSVRLIGLSIAANWRVVDASGESVDCLAGKVVCEGEWRGDGSKAIVCHSTELKVLPAALVVQLDGEAGLFRLVFLHAGRSVFRSICKEAAANYLDTGVLPAKVRPERLRSCIVRVGSQRHIEKGVYHAEVFVRQPSSHVAAQRSDSFSLQALFTLGTIRYLPGSNTGMGKTGVTPSLMRAMSNGSTDPPPSAADPSTRVALPPLRGARERAEGAAAAHAASGAVPSGGWDRVMTLPPLVGHARQPAVDVDAGPIGPQLPVDVEGRIQRGLAQLRETRFEESLRSMTEAAEVAAGMQCPPAAWNARVCAGLVLRLWGDQTGSSQRHGRSLLMRQAIMEESVRVLGPRHTLTVGYILNWIAALADITSTPSSAMAHAASVTKLFDAEGMALPAAGGPLAYATASRLAARARAHSVLGRLQVLCVGHMEAALREAKGRPMDEAQRARQRQEMHNLLGQTADSYADAARCETAGRSGDGPETQTCLLFRACVLAIRDGAGSEFWQAVSAAQRMGTATRDALLTQRANSAAETHGLCILAKSFHLRDVRRPFGPAPGVAVPSL
eukprot:TRINITY_DN296_c0_g2_i1.p1 TRINITY_DN296_c0_g2~~TRINITY_DN296_c0_g2_i1.p1  ORF type:complete len:563 (-),score=48.58 TRINITY_DN296_c0_g2_i1:485-2173(-)